MVKEIELNRMGLQEMSTQEMEGTQGGLAGWIIAGLVALTISAINDFGDIREGIVDGWNGHPRH